MRLERYSGIYSASINPANTADNPNNWDLSLFSADIFFENNYAFLRNTSLPNALRNTDNIVSIIEHPPENPRVADVIHLDFFDRKAHMRAVLQSRVSGPGFSFRFGENNVIGLTSAMRSEFSAYKIPQILAYRTISDLARNQVYSIAPAGFAGMVWGELGLHYSRSNTDSDLHTAWGLSPKLLFGYEGFYTRAQTSFDYSQRIGDTSAFGSARWDYALTMGNVADSDHVRLRKQGSGFGMDAGISWAQPNDDDGSEGYAWRFGVSLLDLGFVRFRKSAERHHIEFDTLITVSNADFPSRDNASDVLRDASQAFLNDPDASLRGRSFAIGLPSALSLQFDAQLAGNFYVAGLIVQRIPMLQYSVKRPNTLAIVPRLEQRWLSFSLPVVLNDWQSLRIGAAARLGWLYIGTDNIGSFFKKKRLTGSDFYIGLKINAFSLNINGRNRLTKESSTKRGRQQWRRIKCYQF